MQHESYGPRSHPQICDLWTISRAGRRQYDLPRVMTMIDSLSSKGNAGKPAQSLARSRTILVVEDDEDQNVFISHVLTAGGYRVVTASGGADGIRLVRTHKIDLVVTDLAMPAVSGVQVIAAIKADPDSRRIPVLVVTAYTWDELGRAALDAGADAYIAKPITQRRLLDEVAKRLNPAPVKPQTSPKKGAGRDASPFLNSNPAPARLATIPGHRVAAGPRSQ